MVKGLSLHHNIDARSAWADRPTSRSGWLIHRLHMVPLKMVRRGAPIFGTSDSPWVVGIFQGVARVVSHSLNGKRQVLRFLLPGDTFGLFANDPSLQIAEAATDVKFAARPWRQVLQAVLDDPSLATQMVALGAREQADFCERLQMIACANAEVRLAWFLLRFMANTGGREQEPFALPLVRQDIADHLGLSLETTSRLFSRLKAQGLICEAPPRSVTIVDGERLRQLARRY